MNECTPLEEGRQAAARRRSATLRRTPREAALARRAAEDAEAKEAAARQLAMSRMVGGVNPHIYSYYTSSTPLTYPDYTPSTPSITLTHP